MQDVRHATVGETDTVGSVSGPAEPASEVEGGGHLPPPPSIKDLPPPTKGTVEPPEAPVQGAKMPASPLIPPPPPDPTLGDVSRESHTPAKYPAVDPAGQPHGKKNGSAGQPVTAVQETVTSENPHSNPNPSPNPNPKPNPNPNPGHHRPVAGLQQQPYRVQSPAQAGGPAPGQAHAHASSPVGQQIPLQGPPLPRHGLPMMPPRPGPPMAQLPRHGSPLVHTPHHVPPMGLPSHHRPPMGQPPPPSPVLRAHPFAEPAARPPRFQEPVVRQPGYQVPRPGGSSYRGEAQILYQEEVPPQYHEERLSYVEEGAAFQGEGMYGEKGAVYVEEGGSLTEESPTQVPGQARHPRRQTSTLRISKWVNPIPDDPEDGQQQSGEQELATKMLQIQSKRFYIDVKQNRRGRFMKVAEIGADGRRNQVFLALSTAAEFRDHLSHFSDFYANLGPPNPDTLPEDGKLKSETMVKDNRRYYLDLKENSRGRFLRVSQTIARGGPRCQIAIPAQGMIEFRDALQELLDEFGTDDGGYKGELPEGRHMRVENKNFYFDIGQNNRGIYMRISEVKTNFRTAITIPEKSWSRFRDIFADYVDKMKDGGEKGPSESNK